MIREIADALAQSWHNFSSAFVLFVPRLVAALIIFAGGLLVSLVVRQLVQRLLVSVRFDRVSRRSGTSDLLRRAEMPPAEVLIGRVFFWIVLILNLFTYSTACCVCRKPPN